MLFFNTFLVFKYKFIFIVFYICICYRFFFLVIEIFLEYLFHIHDVKPLKHLVLKRYTNKGFYFYFYYYYCIKEPK